MAALRLAPPPRRGFAARRSPSRRWPWARNIALSPITFPTSSKLRLLVECAFGADPTADPATWSWTDVGAYVRYEDKIQIQRGRPDASATVPPSRCAFTVDNRDGNWVEDNPYGAWFGLLTLGTPVRVSVDPGDGMHTRFAGFIYDLPPRWDVSERNRYVPITAQGILRRLGQGTAIQGPAQDAAAANDPNLVAYWPCTDRAGSTQAVSTTAGAVALRSNGAVVFGEVSGPSDVGLYPDLAFGGALSGNVPAASVANGWSIEWAAKLKVPPSVAVFPLYFTTAGTVGTWKVIYDTDKTLTLAYMDPVTDSYVDAAAPTTILAAGWHTLRVTAAQSGANIVTNFYIDGTLAGSATVLTQTLGMIRTIRLGANEVTGDVLSSGQLGIYSAAAAASTAVAAASVGNSGELAHARFARVCAENSVRCTTMVGTSVAMGPQPEGTLLTVLRECEAADSAALVETFDFGLALHGHVMRENLAVAMELDHDRAHLQPGFEPTNDDRLRRNDVTASRSAGSSARFVDDADVAKRGTYDESVTVNIAYDADLYPVAGWRVHLGTAAGLRHPRIGINLARTPDLIPAAVGIDVSSRIRLSSPPAGMAPDPVDVLVEQISEAFDVRNWAMEFATSPYTPWHIARTAVDTADGTDHLGHADWDTCVLAEDLDTTETGVDVTTTPLITTNADDLPFDILIGGERMTVTVCVGGSNPQTLTVVRSLNTVVKSHSSGATVEMHPESACYVGL